MSYLSHPPFTKRLNFRNTMTVAQCTSHWGKFTTVHVAEITSLKSVLTLQVITLFHFSPLSEVFTGLQLTDACAECEESEASVSSGFAGTLHGSNLQEGGTVQ